MNSQSRIQQLNCEPAHFSDHVNHVANLDPTRKSSIGISTYSKSARVESHHSVEGHGEFGSNKISWIGINNDSPHTQVYVYCSSHGSYVDFGSFPLSYFKSFSRGNWYHTLHTAAQSLELVRSLDLFEVESLQKIQPKKSFFLLHRNLYIHS